MQAFSIVRPLEQGMGVAVARRSFFRGSDNEDMGVVARRVARGNISLVDQSKVGVDEEELLVRAIQSGAVLTSGRHLQHGDENQHKRNLELFANCASAPLSFINFLFLLNGSGVGRLFDDALMNVNWHAAPELVIMLKHDHPDYPKTREQFFRMGTEFSLLPFGTKLEDFSDEEYARVKAWVEDNIVDQPQFYRDNPETNIDSAVVYHRVKDSREGWAVGAELYEVMAWQHRALDTLILDFTDLRENGAPIAGMQGRPASGPMSTIRAFLNIAAKVVNAEEQMELWEQAMRVDDFYSQEVQVGGARRAARLSGKSWRDKSIFKFIAIKANCGLWTSNNSVIVDSEFWARVLAWVSTPKAERANLEELTLHAAEVFIKATEFAYLNGEPGFINIDLMDDIKSGVAYERPVYDNGQDIGCDRYPVTYGKELFVDVAKRSQKLRYPLILNPCGEISFSALGSYCLVGDIAPLMACPFDFERRPGGVLSTREAQDWDDAVELAGRLQARFLMRVNGMQAFFGEEVKRTERIGVSLTGIQEWAWARFGFSFDDLIDEQKSAPFWRLVERVSFAIKDEAPKYAAVLGIKAPVTVVTTKPSGSISKLYGLCEGAHLPAHIAYLRWVQFRGSKDGNGNWYPDTDPLVIDYERRGFPVRTLSTYKGVAIVGFPTLPLLSSLMPAEKIVTASQASPADQYAYLRLLERYWLGERGGCQISYTIKLYKDRVSLSDFRRVVLENQPTVRCCTLMPTLPESQLGYEYLPEQPLTIEEYEEVVSKIDSVADQVVTEDDLRCMAGVCPL